MAVRDEGYERLAAAEAQVAQIETILRKYEDDLRGLNIVEARLPDRAFKRIIQEDAWHVTGLRLEALPAQRRDGEVGAA